MDSVTFFIANDLEALKQVQRDVNSLCKENNCKIKQIDVLERSNRQFIISIVFEETQEFAFLPNGTKVMLERGKK